RRHGRQYRGRSRLRRNAGQSQGNHDREARLRGAGRGDCGPRGGAAGAGFVTLPTWPRAGGDAPATARLRASRSDFVVEEQLGFEPEGAGEHCWLWVEKEGLNTVEAARRLARFAGIREADIAYSGMKDRHAVTRQ